MFEAPYGYLSSVYGSRYGGTPPLVEENDPYSNLRRLLEQLQQPSAPPPRSFHDLPIEDRRSANRMGLLAAAASIANAGRGELGSALAQGAAMHEGYRRQAFDDYRERAAREENSRRAALQERFRLEQIEQQVAEEEEARARESRLSAATATPPAGVEVDPAVWADLPISERLQAHQRARTAKAEAEERKTAAENVARAAAASGGDPDMARESFLAGVSPGEAIRLSMPEKPNQPERPREGTVLQDAHGNYFLVDQVTGETKPIGLQGQPKGGEGADPERELREAAYAETLKQQQDAAGAFGGGAPFEFDAAYRENLERRRRLVEGPKRPAYLPSRTSRRPTVTQRRNEPASPFRGAGPQEKTHVNTSGGMPASLFSLVAEDPDTKALAAKLRGEKNPDTGRNYTWAEIEALLSSSLSRYGGR